jgi:hypothetical protein
MRLTDSRGSGRFGGVVESSALTHLKCRVDRLQFCLGVAHFHLPIDAALCCVDVGRPGGGFLAEDHEIGESASGDALTGERT